MPEASVIGSLMMKTLLLKINIAASANFYLGQAEGSYAKMKQS